MTDQLEHTFSSIIEVWIREQNHTQSSYTYHTLARKGKGTLVCRTGMTWGGMRPSDDKMQYHYNIPANMFASVALQYMIEMANTLWSSVKWIEKAQQLKKDIDQGIHQYGIFNGTYAYEVDGCGSYLMADDANIPSLLSARYLGYPVNVDVYARTRKFILSSANPWYRNGTVLFGIGSPHSRLIDAVWHLSLIMEAMSDASQYRRVLAMVLKTSEHGLREAVSGDGKRSRRPWFGWANSLFSEWMIGAHER
jgi:meiotically up-regulated gene 157 (Mug157) protein